MAGVDDYQKISKDFLETSIDFENLFEKSATVSKEARKIGNQLYVQGNHDQSIHKDILLQYSKSVAFAPNNSEDLALAYGNRSALLLHLHQYQQCLVDINRALQISNSNKLKCKLQARHKKCLNLMTNSNEKKNGQASTTHSNCKENKQSLSEKITLISQDNDHVPKLPSFTPSTVIESASEAVAIKYNKKYGRHLVATRNIKPGEVIIAERGYVCYPIISKRYLVCSHCLSFAWSGVPCESCAFAMYCSELCRKEAWKQYHDLECTFCQYISCMFYDEENFVPDLIVAIRLFIIAVKREGLDTVMNESQIGNNQVEGLMVNGKLYSDKFRCCINLLSYLQSHKEEDVEYNVSIAANALFEYENFVDLMKNKSNDVSDKHLIRQLENILKKLAGIIDVNSFKYQAMVCNCKSLVDCQMECESTRGIILAPISSLINHSCNSNVNRLFMPNGKVVMFTIAPIKEGDQLFESYGPVFTMEREERQSQLLNGFNFTCDCRPCKENWPINLHFVDSEKKRIIYKKIMLEFNYLFPYACESTIFSDELSKWEFDEETLKHAVKLSELIYKYIDNYKLATFCNLPYRYYIDKAFYMLYGEKCVVPHGC